MRRKEDIQFHGEASGFDMPGTVAVLCTGHKSVCVCVRRRVSRLPFCHPSEHQKCNKSINRITCKIKNSNVVSGYVKIGRVFCVFCFIFVIVVFAFMKTNELMKQYSVPYLELL